MRSWYVSRRNESILNARVMAIFAAALVLILVWLLPREQTFRDMLANQQADRVSIAYARLLLGISPEDDELRQLLAGQYYQLGEFSNAWAIIKDNNGDSTVLGIKILQEITYAEEPGKSRAKWQKQLLSALEKAVTSDKIANEDLSELARTATGLNKPRLAAGLRERIYTATGASEDLRRAAQAWIAADAPEYAVKILLRDGVPKQEELLKLSITAALASGQTSLSLSVVNAYLADQSAAQADLNSETPGPSADLVAHFVRALLAANRSSRVPQFLQMLADPETLTLRQATEFASAAVASGELALAKSFMERALSLEANDAALISQLAQVYEWSGQPEDALEMWLRATDNSSDDKTLDRAWRLSRDLYHYRNVANLLSKMAKDRRLTDEEVAVLRLAWEQHGDPEQGEQVLIDYTKRHPEHRRAWQERIALQVNNLQLEAADSSWAQFNLHHTLSIAENQGWADIKWRRYRAREALETLLLREPMVENTAYWRQLAVYAWFLDEPGIASRAMEERLAYGEKLNNYEMGQLIQGSQWSNPEMVAVHAATAWQNQPENLEFLLTALYAALDAGNSATADELFTKALNNSDIAELINDNPQFWTLRANHLEQRGDFKGAKLALNRALALDPANMELRANQLWIFIASQNLKALRQSLARLSAVADEHASLWAPMASGYALLQEHRQAIPWFNKALQQDTTDVGLLLAYSGSLEALGWRDPAYRLRRHTLKLLAAQSAKRQESRDGINADTLIAASRDIISGPQQRALLRQLLATAPPPAKAKLPYPLFDSSGSEDSQTVETDQRHSDRLAAIARFEFSDALRREHYSSARYWLSTGAKASPGDRLMLAADEYDEDILAGLALDDSYSLSSQAALALGQPGFAMSKTLEELQRNPRNQLALDMRESISRELQPSGWQVQPVFEELGNYRFTGAEFLFSQRFERFHLDTRLRHQEASPQILQGPENFAEQSLHSTATYENGWGTGAIGIGFTKGDERRLLSLNWEQEFIIDRRNTLVLALEHGARLQGGGVTQALLSRSGAGLTWNTSVSARLQINTNLMNSTYSDQDNTAVGNVTQFTISPNYILSRSGPTINLRGQAQWIMSSEQKISAALEEFLQFPNQEVLPGDTRSLSIGGVIARDRPGELDWRRSGTHYRVSADVGYRWPQQNLTFNSEAAIGVPVFGRDRLTAAAIFTNSLDNEISESGIRAQLTYSRRLN